mmetsp:Transcript_9387/g.38372  ORF Transcript_9387/g.38372 Transcript_9387/m.38372 type:complete len:420 (+) Transcript_9387:1292-2551(+)
MRSQHEGRSDDPQDSRVRRSPAAGAAAFHRSRRLAHRGGGCVRRQVHRQAAAAMAQVRGPRRAPRGGFVRRLCLRRRERNLGPATGRRGRRRNAPGVGGAAPVEEAAIRGARVEARRRPNRAQVCAAARGRPTGVPRGWDVRGGGIAVDLAGEGRRAEARPRAARRGGHLAAQAGVRQAPGCLVGGRRVSDAGSRRALRRLRGGVPALRFPHVARPDRSNVPAVWRRLAQAPDPRRWGRRDPPGAGPGEPPGRHRARGEAPAERGARRVSRTPRGSHRAGHDAGDPDAGGARVRRQDPRRAQRRRHVELRSRREDLRRGGGAGIARAHRRGGGVVLWRGGHAGGGRGSGGGGGSRGGTRAIGGGGSRRRGAQDWQEEERHDLRRQGCRGRRPKGRERGRGGDPPRSGCRARRVYHPEAG